MVLNNKLQKHVIFCSNTDQVISQGGRQAELDTVQYLVDNLSVRKVGQHRLLVNYNLPLRNPGQSGILEIDVVVVNKLGVFVLEVKDWQGVIEAYDDYWIQLPNFKRNNAFNSIEYKAKVLHSTLFGYNGRLRDLERVSVTGLVVLVRGVQNFENRSHNSKVEASVVGLGPDLIRALSSKRLLHRGKDSQILEDDDIQQVKVALYSSHQVDRDRIIGNYRVVGELSPGDLFKAYEAVNIHVETQRVRIKCYRLPNISSESKRTLLRFKRNAEAVAKLENHPNIIQTFSFFPDNNRADVFYEITELPRGIRLDEMMAQCTKPLSLTKQLAYLESLCKALAHAHKNKIYHRNLNPQTVFVAEDNVKLADFDFAKLVDRGTISIPGQTLVDSIFTAPEIFLNSSAASPASDIYSLGVLWYFLASLPEHPQKVDVGKVDGLKLEKTARDLIKKMLSRVVKSRPQSIDEVLAQLKALK